MEKNKTNTQQPDVKVNSSSLGEGECTGVSKKTTGVLESGKSKQYPSAEVKQDPTRNESPEERINKKLVTDYVLLKSDCAENMVTNWKEIQGLLRIKMELRHLL